MFKKNYTKTKGKLIYKEKLTIYIKRERERDSCIWFFKWIVYE